MASLLLRSAGRVLRRSLPQGPFRRTPAQPFVDNPRLFSSDGVNKHSCKLEKGLRQCFESRLASFKADVAALSRKYRAMREQAEVRRQKEIENPLEENERVRKLWGFSVAVQVYLILLSRYDSWSQEGEKSGAVKPEI